jgi:ABC-type phosphate transport system substrate-binding protein
MKFRVAGVVVLLTGLVGAAALAQSPDVVNTYDAVIAKYGDGLKENMRIRFWHDEYTGGRAPKKFYPATWDLRELPEYAPKAQLSGTLRISGYYLIRGQVGKLWVEGFTKFHPQVKVVTSEGGDLAGGQIDIMTGPRMNDRLLETSKFEGRTKHRVFEIDWATGSYNVPGWSPAFATFVHKGNPLEHLTLEQVDGIFGGARTGGWNGTTWRTDIARGPEKNIRTWGQLGLGGEWADKPIHVYGRPLKYNIQLGFERKVFGGGDLWNENVREYSHELNPDGTRYSSAVEMVKDLAKDPYGICFSDLGSTDITQVKALAIAAKPGEPAYPLTLENLRARRYPLFVEQWAMVSQEPGKPLDPIVKEFLTYMLSRQGQAAIEEDGKWLPIPASTARAGLEKLDRPGDAVNPAEMGLQVPEIAPSLGDGEGPDETGTARAQQRYYTQQFDLGDLPRYQPEQRISGTIRLPQGSQLLGSTVGEAWMRGFAKYHPDVKFETAKGTLAANQVDVQIGRKMTTYFGGEYLQFQLAHQHSPLEIQVATGSYDVPGWSPALTIFVNKNSPLDKLTMAQVDGIFGGPRRGGWAGTTWRRQVGRGADKNIRTWGQLGAGGAWNAKPIDVYGPPVKYHIMSVFERKVFQGGNMWNDALREYPLAVNADGSKRVPGAETVKDVAANQYGITFSQKAFQTADVRPLAIAANDGGPYVLPTLENVRNRTYPLSLEVYAYVDPTPGKPLDPKLKEFLRYVLSREGQDAVMRDGKWLPLTAALVQEQRKKLDAIVAPIAFDSAQSRHR